MMKNKHIICTLVLMTAAWSAAAATVAAADSTLRLSLGECREMALRENAAARTAANDIKMARETSAEAFTRYFPDISAAGMGFWANHDVIQYDVLNLFEIGMIKKGYTAGITAVQPIFAGGRIVNGNALARVGEQVAEMRRRQTDEDVCVSVDRYYWKLVSLNAQKETLTSLLVMLDTLTYQTQAAVDAGVILKNDLLKVELQRNDFRNTMIDLDNGIALCSNLLGQYIGAGLTPVAPADSLKPGDMPEFDFSLWCDPQSAVGDTPAYGMLNSAVKAAELEKKLAVGDNLPTVGVGAGWYFHDLLEQHQNFGAVFLSVAVPLSGWWGGSHAIRKKDLAVQNARIQLEDGQEMLQIAMRDAWDNLTAAYRKMQNANEGIAQARENLRLNQNYYKVGVSSVTDLLDAQTLYKKACDQYISACADYRVRMAEYLKATGRLPGEWQTASQDARE